MVRNSLTIVAAVLTSCCVCLAVSWATQSRTGVAVVDLDEVSKLLGRQVEMQTNLQTRTTETQQKLAAIEQNAAAQLEEARRSLGQTPTTEQAQQFQRMQQSAVLQLNQLKQKAEMELNGHRQQLVSQFREQSRPVVAEVAKKHGFTTVITRNDNFLFSYEKAVDITAEVAKLMAANGTAAPAAPAAATPAAEKPVAATTSSTWPAKAGQSAAAKPAIQQVKHEAP